MASIASEPGGRRRLIVRLPDGRRITLRLGVVPLKTAESFKAHAEELLVAAAYSRALPMATAQWAEGLPGRIRQQLERYGLLAVKAAVDSPTVAAWCTRYIGTRARAVKPGTLENLGQTQSNLVEFLGADKLLTAISPGDATEFRDWLTGRGLARATVCRRLRRAKQFLEAAFKKRMLPANPWADVKAGSFANPKLRFFVTPEATAAVLEACPSIAWRAAVALARYGGLRCPSEVLGLAWQDVDWAGKRFIVRSGKTETAANGGIRIVPMFAEVGDVLQEAFDAAPVGAVSVVEGLDQGGHGARVNLRTGLRGIILRAGLTPWPRVWQNLRASRATELNETFPAHVVAAWLGHSVAVEAEHYLSVLPSHYAKAVEKAARNPARIPARQAPARPGKESQETGAGEENPIECGVLRDSAGGCDGAGLLAITREGTEPADVTGNGGKDLRIPASESGAQSGALSADSASPNGPSTPDLAEVPTADLLAELHRLGEREAAVLAELGRRQEGKRA